jgi:hypothetical protein
VFLLGWISWFLPFDDLLDRRGTPLGADFAMFYVAGQVVLDGATDRLYDQAEHQLRLQALFPGIDEQFCLPYRYPPFVALLMAPLAALPYAVSFACFFALSCAAWWTALWILARDLQILRGPWRGPILVAIVGWPVALETLIGGQASMFALLLLTAAIVLVRRHQFVWAGVILALAAYKPNVLAFITLALALRYPRVLLGAIPAWVALGMVSLIPNGWSGISDYLTLGMQLAVQTWDVETPFWKVHSLASWFELLPGGQERVVSLAVGLASTVTVVWIWRRAIGDSMTGPVLATLVSINALFNPYTPIYDLTLLLPGVLLTAESLWLRYGNDLEGRLGTAQLILAALYFGPHLSQLSAKALGVQSFALVLLALAVWQAVQLLKPVHPRARVEVSLEPVRSAGP